MPSISRPPSRSREPWQPAAWVVLYAVAAWLGGVTRPEASGLALVWPAAGVALLWMLRTWRGSRPPIVDCVLLVAVAGAVTWATGAPWAQALALAPINLVQALIAVWVLHRLHPRPLVGLRDLRCLLALSAGSAAGALVAALLGSVALSVLASHSFVGTFEHWVLGNTVSSIAIAAAGLVLLTRQPPRPSSAWRNGELPAFVALTVFAHAVVFGPGNAAGFGYLVLPAVAWAGLRLGVRVSAAHLLASGAVVTISTILGWGPFGSVEPLLVRLGIAQGFIGVVAVIGLGLALSQQERDRALAEAEDGQLMLHQNVESALIGNALVLLDDRGRGQIMLANPAIATLYATTPDLLVGRSWVSMLAEDEQEAMRHVLQEIEAGVARTWQGQVQHRSAKGRDWWCQAAIAELPERNGQRLATVQLLDVTSRRQLESRLTYMALHDDLTGLPNRTLLRDRVEHSLAASRRSGKLVALLFFDIDHFKTVNDSLGHPSGDQVLVALAERLRTAVRPGDTVARIGGDEFVVCCIAVDDVLQTFELAERIKAAVSAPIALDHRLITVSVSGGVTMSTPTCDVTDLLRESDSAMYEAKKRGGNRIELFVPDLQTRAQRHLDLEQELRDALQHGQFVMHYQPIVDVATEQTIALEALVRWQHPTRGLLGPAEWLDVAEDSGLMIDLGCWILQESCRQGAAFAEVLPTPITMHVNVSARQLRESEFFTIVRDTLAASNLPAHHLVLELTETHLMHIGADLLADLDRLRGLGVRLDADDFGTGFSCLTQLTVLPIDELKIDKSFILAMGQDRRARAVVHGILGMAKAMGLGVVAEGVETPAAAAELLALGCLSAQGYLWSPPRPAADVLLRLQEQALRGLTPALEVTTAHLGDRRPAGADD